MTKDLIQGEALRASSASEAATVAELAIAAAGIPEIIKTASGREFLVKPEGYDHEDVTEKNAVAPILPDHIRQGVTLQTVDSLVDYANRFKTDETVLFADIDTNTILTAIDYHGPGSAKHFAHLAKMVLPYSVEWKLWTSIDGKLMKQLEFARFLEENAADIAAPSGADLLDACRDLQANRKVNFTKAVRTSSNNENFEFTDETEARTKGGLELPTQFKLSIPVYFNGALTTLMAFLRWELSEGEGLRLGVQLHRAEHVRQAVFKQIIDDAADRIERPAVFGKPFDGSRGQAF